MVLKAVLIPFERRKLIDGCQNERFSGMNGDKLPTDGEILQKNIDRTSGGAGLESQEMLR
jgi:hypothetical protein